jgi:hypothetical protein
MSLKQQYIADVSSRRKKTTTIESAVRSKKVLVSALSNSRSSFFIGGVRKKDTEKKTFVITMRDGERFTRKDSLR